MTVPPGFTAIGKTLEVVLSGVLNVDPTGVLDIHN